jgi:hypothetical protein
MPDGVIQCFQSCPQAGSRTRTGYAVRRGFPRLVTHGAVKGRFIVAGWTGCPYGTDGFASPWYMDLQMPNYKTPDQLADENGVTFFPFWHRTGEVVKYRTAENTVTTYTAIGNAWGPPGPGGWVPGGDASAAVNTYIAAGFWRDGVASYRKGDLVYECVPNADESEDEWCIADLFVCTADVVNAGQPRVDTAHFRPFWATGDDYEYYHVLGVLAAASPVAKGMCVSGTVFNRQRFFRAHVEGAGGSLSNRDEYELLATQRPVFNKDFTVYQCDERESHRRWRTMRESTVIEGVDSSDTVYRIAAGGEMRVEYGHLIDWGEPPAGPYTRTKGGNFPYFWRGPQFIFPGAQDNLWEPRILWSRLKEVTLTDTLMRFVWDIGAERWTPDRITMPEAFPEYVETTATQEVTLEDEFTLEEQWGAVIFPPWVEGYGPAGGGSAVAFGAVNYLGPQRDPQLRVTQARHFVLGPTYCERTFYCDGRATRCATKDVTGCAGAELEYVPTLADLGTTTVVADNCQCAP